MSIFGSSLWPRNWSIFCSPLKDLLRCCIAWASRWPLSLFCKAFKWNPSSDIAPSANTQEAGIHWGYIQFVAYYINWSQHIICKHLAFLHFHMQSICETCAPRFSYLRKVNHHPFWGWSNPSWCVVCQHRARQSSVQTRAPPSSVPPSSVQTRAPPRPLTSQLWWDRGALLRGWGGTLAVVCRFTVGLKID